MSETRPPESDLEQKVERMASMTCEERNREELRLAAEVAAKLAELTAALHVREEVIAETRSFVERVYPLLFPEKK